MKLDLDIYQTVLQNGLNLTSPATDIASQSIGALSDLEDMLNPVDLPGVDLGVINNVKSKISLASSGLNSTVSHISANVDKTLSLGSVASQINQIDAVVGNVPSSCFNTDAVMGMVMGEADEMLGLIGDKAGLAGQAVSDFMAGLIDATQLEAMLGNVMGEIDAALSSVLALVEAEKQVWDEVVNKLKASSAAQAITALWNDPCTQAILDKTLPPEIKHHLPPKL